MKATKSYFIERHGGGERAILLQLDTRTPDFDSRLFEFQELARAASVEVLSVITGKLDKPYSRYFVGSGKADQLAKEVAALEAEVMLVNHELTAAQGRNLEQLCGCRVIARTELILDIFAKRARTFEGKLQVELAQLQHLSSRLVGGWSHLERQKGGIGLRGPGEKQLETDRRLIGVRIQAIKKRLEKVAVQRHQGRKARKKAAIPTVSLVGYTNAGKSTLFNSLTHSSVFTADLLFATLDPTLRRLNLPPLGKVILADTVGFIRDLPHDLVAAFRATLEETSQADLLLHVIDVANNDREIRDSMIEDVNLVLKEIGADQVPCLQIFNKIDLNPTLQPHLDRADDGVPRQVWLSAKTTEGFDLLRDAIIEILGRFIIYCQLTLGPEEAKLRTLLYAKGAVVSEQNGEQGESILQLAIQAEDYQRLLVGKPVKNIKSNT